MKNGVAERANRTISEGITTMLNEAHLPPSFWWTAVAAFTHVHNRSPTAALQSGTPYEHWHSHKPDVSHLRVYGCISYVHIKKDQRKQLQSHTQKCVFIGYPANYKGWLFWNPVSRKEVLSDSAEFDERAFPGNSRTPVQLQVLSEARDLAEKGGVEIELDSDDEHFLPHSAAQRPPLANSGIIQPPAPKTRSAVRQELVQQYREPTPVLSESDEDPLQQSTTPAADDEDSGDELDLIGDSHETDNLADAALDSTLHSALSICLTHDISPMRRHAVMS